jgi:hypothetical protein
MESVTRSAHVGTRASRSRCARTSGRWMSSTTRSRMPRGVAWRSPREAGAPAPAGRPQRPWGFVENGPRPPVRSSARSHCAAVVRERRPGANTAPHLAPGSRAAINRRTRLLKPRSSLRPSSSGRVCRVSMCTLGVRSSRTLRARARDREMKTRPWKRCFSHAMTADGSRRVIRGGRHGHSGPRSAVRSRKARSSREI